MAPGHLFKKMKSAQAPRAYPARMIHAPAGSIGPKISMGYARWPSAEIKFLRE
jgi:hypothetical protein